MCMQNEMHSSCKYPSKMQIKEKLTCWMIGIRKLMNVLVHHYVFWIFMPSQKVSVAGEMFRTGTSVSCFLVKFDKN